MKKLFFIFLFLPSFAYADRLGSLRSGADVLLTTQTSIQSGSTNYIQNSATPTISTQEFQVLSFEVIGGSATFKSTAAVFGNFSVAADPIFPHNVTGLGAVAFGSFNQATGDYSFATGETTAATGYGSMTFGVDTTASGQGSWCGGAASLASGFSSFAFGSDCLSSGNLSFSFGSFAEASNSLSWAVGGSITTSSQTAFSFGQSFQNNQEKSFKVGWSDPPTFNVYTDTIVVRGNLQVIGGTVTLATPLAIAAGGTGQTTATPAFDALAPTTTQGDIIYHNGTDNVRLAKGTAGQILQMNSGATAPEWGTKYGYTLQAYNHTGSPTDGVTWYVGSQWSLTPLTTAGRNKIYIPKTATLKAAYIYIDNGGTLGSSETATISFRLNDTTDTTITSAATYTAISQSFSNTALSVAVSAGDFFEVKVVFPTFATNPTSIRHSLVLYFE